MNPDHPHPVVLELQPIRVGQGLKGILQGCDREGKKEQQQNGG